jgi:hypothetical protein
MQVEATTQDVGDARNVGKSRADRGRTAANHDAMMRGVWSMPRSAPTLLHTELERVPRRGGLPGIANRGPGDERAL